MARPGPTDGEVVGGSSTVNESMLTGESIPAQKNEHDTVIAGAINDKGSLNIKVTHTGLNS